MIIFVTAIYIFPKTVFFYPSAIQQQNLAIHLVDFYYPTKFTSNVDLESFFKTTQYFIILSSE